jgi:hypothetical protein
MLISRRGLITGLAGFLAAPAIVRASSLMPVTVWAEPLVVGPEMTATEVIWRQQEWARQLAERIVNPPGGITRATHDQMSETYRLLVDRFGLAD